MPINSRAGLDMMSLFMVLTGSMKLLINQSRDSTVTAPQRRGFAAFQPFQRLPAEGQLGWEGSAAGTCSACRAGVLLTAVAKVALQTKLVCSQTMAAWNIN